MKLLREADLIQWHFLPLHAVERREHAGFAIAQLFTRGNYPYIQHDKASLNQLLSSAIKIDSDKPAPKTVHGIETIVFCQGKFSGKDNSKSLTYSDENMEAPD